MKSDKLNELLQQRKAIEEHLRWLDRQIAEVRECVPAPEQTDTDDTTASVADTESSPPPAEDLVELPPVDPKNIRLSIIRGCAFYLAVAIFLLFLIALGIYLLPGR